MGKVLRILVILIMLLGIAACFFAYKNYSKREVLAGRAHAFEEFVVKLAVFFEKEDLQKVDPPSTFPERDISEITSRELENPERGDFWRSYKYYLESEDVTANMLSYRDEASRKQLRQYFRVDPATGEYVIDYSGKPATEGPGTMSEILETIIERASAQYRTLCDTRAELTKVRKELVETIEALNAIKPPARADKKTIEELNQNIAQLRSTISAKEAEIATKDGEIETLNGDIEVLNDEKAELGEKVTELEDALKERDQMIKDLRGKNTEILPTSTVAVQDGVLTPGIKGKVVECSEEWKYAIIEFSPEFMNELIGPARDRALPQVEVMVKRADDDDPDSAFVTRLKLRQAIRGKNIVTADILTDWQQKPVKIGDIIYY